MSQDDWSRLSILAITLTTNIPNWRKIYYRPTMTLPGVSKESVIYFPGDILIRKSDLGDDLGDHDKIKVFLSARSLGRILDKKLHRLGYKQARRFATKRNEGNLLKNLELILKVLFHKGEKFYIEGKPYTVNSYKWSENAFKGNLGNGANQFPVTIFRTPKSETEDTASRDSPILYHLYNVNVTLGLTEKLDQPKHRLYCDAKANEIYNLSDDILTAVVDSAIGAAPILAGATILAPGTIQRSYRMPPGFTTYDDWRTARGERGMTFYYNQYTGASTYNPREVAPHRLIHLIRPWTGSNRPPLPTTRPGGEVYAAPGGGKRRRKTRRKRRKTLRRRRRGRKTLRRRRRRRH